MSEALVVTRHEGSIPWEWIEDRLRRPRQVSMWDGLADFALTAAEAYRREVWTDQPAHLEAWLEKDALSRIFENALEPYGVTLGLDPQCRASARWGRRDPLLRRLRPVQ